MKQLLLIILISWSLHIHSQQTPAQRKQLTENNLFPDIIYGDSLPRLNLEKLMAEWGIKGVSIAVVKDYKIDWAQGYGWADEQEKIPVTVNTRFQAASISKSVNSLAIFKLVQEGKLDLDTDINTYLKSWKFPYDSLSKNKKITLRNLLTHTAGLTVHGFRGYEYGDTIPTVIQVLNGQKPANSPAVRSQFAPSERFQYSGGGTTISQLILTDITGMAYEEYLKKNVLQPIGMTNSFFNQPPPSGTKELAAGHYGNGGQVKGKYHIYPEKAAAGLWTTPTDLARFIIESQLEYEGKSTKVLSRETMKKRMAFNIDSFAGHGVFIVNKQGESWFSHNGGNEGFVCVYYGSFKGGNGVAIMTNSDNFGIISSILNSVALTYNWKNFSSPVFRKKIALPRDTLQNYTGKYLMGTRDTLAVFFCGEELCISQNQQPPNGFKMLFTDNISVYIEEVPGIQIKLVRNAEGKIDALDILENGGTIRGRRIE